MKQRNTQILSISCFILITFTQVTAIQGQFTKRTLEDDEKDYKWFELWKHPDFQKEYFNIPVFYIVVAVVLILILLLVCCCCSKGSSKESQSQEKGKQETKPQDNKRVELYKIKEGQLNDQNHQVVNDQNHQMDYSNEHHHHQLNYLNLNQEENSCHSNPDEVKEFNSDCSYCQPECSKSDVTIKNEDITINNGDMKQAKPMQNQNLNDQIPQKQESLKKIKNVDKSEPKVESKIDSKAEIYQLKTNDLYRSKMKFQNVKKKPKKIQDFSSESDSD